MQAEKRETRSPAPKLFTGCHKGNDMDKKRRLERQKQEAVKQQDTPQAIPTRAGDYLQSLDEYHAAHPHLQVILYSRESTHPQDDNHETHLQPLRKACKKRGIPVAGSYTDTKTGKTLEREEFRKAIQHAKRCKRHTAMLATSTDRYIRPENFTPYQFDLLPIEAELEKLEAASCGVPLLTLLDPDTRPGEVKSRHIRSGQAVKQNKGGQQRTKRPGWKKQRKRDQQPEARELHKQGLRICEIVRKLGVPRSTVVGWL